MTRKKIFATLTAVCCTAGAMLLHTPITHAEIIATPEGYLAYLTQGTFQGLLIETDGTALTEEDFSSIDGFVGLQTYEDFTKEYIWGYTETSIIPESTAYVLYTEAMDDNTKTSLGRFLTQEINSITQTHIIEKSTYQRAHFEESFYIETASPDTILDEETIPELAGYEIIRNQSDLPEYQKFYTVNFPETLIEEVNAQYSTDGEKYAYYCTIADSLMEKYSDILVSAACQVIVLDSPAESEYTASSIWNSAGDLDADGEINASDAAELLVLSAMKGATADGSGYDPFTTEQKSAADLNGDTFCDANDAAYILQFAAEAGAGSELSIGEFMTRE